MNLPYTAVVNWPRPQIQIDWIDCVLGVEEWCNQHVGVQGQDWQWVGPEFAPSWLCVVMFAREMDKTLFLLRWSV